MGNAILRRSRRACSMCNAIDHIEGEWYVSSTPTCIYTGSETLKCTRCNETLDVRELPIVTPDNPDFDYANSIYHYAVYGGSDWGREDYVDGCAVYTWYHYCTRCDWVALPTEPSYYDHKDIKTGVFAGNESTCVTKGKETTYCWECKMWISDKELELDPNNHEEWVDGGDGVEGHCTACGAVCDHEFENGMIEGVGERSYCVKCGYYDV